MLLLLLLPPPLLKGARASHGGLQEGHCGGDGGGAIEPGGKGQ